MTAHIFHSIREREFILNIHCSDGANNFLLLQVRSRSLTQLDALSTGMLDTGEHHLESDSSQQQPHHLHQHQQPHQLQHHPLSIECNRIRFLAPGAAPVEIVHPNRTRHKLSRSQVKLKVFTLLQFDTSAFSA